MKITNRGTLSVLLMSVLAGILLQFPANATAQTTADLAISIYNTLLDVYTNDYMPYTMYVTNLGPGTVSSVVVSNTLPVGFSLIDASPAYTYANNTLTFNLGSLTNLAVRKLVVRAEPVNSGSYTVSASISSSSNTDPNGANDAANFGVNVGDFSSANLSASISSSQQIDFQTGLEEQSIQVSNNGSMTVPSVRVMITGLTRQLWMAAGTNNGNPFVISGAPLEPGKSVDFLLEFYPRGSFSFTDSQLHPVASKMEHLSPPANLGKPLAVQQEVRLSSGSVLIDWFSDTNKSYTILYSDNPDFSNPLMSPQIVPPASANQSEWIDYGPPATISFPTNTPRYYRIYTNP